MTEIVIKKYNGGTVTQQQSGTAKVLNGSVYRTLHLRNYVGFLPNLQTPIDKIEMPEAKAGDAILTKLFGNTLTFTLDWMLLPETTSVVDETVVKTPHDQMIFLITEFSQDSINDAYSISIFKPTTDGSTRDYLDIGCAITSMVITRSKTDPNNFVATMTVQVGTYVTATSV